MNTLQQVRTAQMQARLSTLWIFILLNVIFRDIHELFRPGVLEEMGTGTVGGVQMTEGLLLRAGILLEIPIAMVLLSQVLPYRVNRWANIVVAPLVILSVLAARPSDLDDIFFASMEIVALLVIAWAAWRYPKPELSPDHLTSSGEYA